MINALKLNNKAVLNNIGYYLLIILFGVIWGFGQYPATFKIPLYLIRFFGLIPFLYIILYRKHYAIDAQIFGWVAYIINFYWLYHTFKVSGKMPVYLATGIPLLLCFYYGLQYPLIAFITKLFYKFNKKLLFLFPIIFVFIDTTFIKLFRHTIVDSQIDFYWFIQLIDITGTTGITLIIMFFNLGLFILIRKLVIKKKIKFYDFIFIIPFILALTYGFFRIQHLKNDEKKCEYVYAAMIQGNITGKQKMEAKYFWVNIDRYNDLTKTASYDKDVEFIIWPESVFTRAFDGNKNTLRKYIKDKYPPLILGISTKSYKPNKNNPVYTNSCYLIENQSVKEKYDKRHLLAFGEYVPFEKTFPFLRKITPLRSSFSPGKEEKIFKVNDKTRACISICFEEIFPDEIRKKVNTGCNLMINITNDSWYGNTVGPIHHSILGRLRGIENRRSFYRCTATGVTTASDFTGKVIKTGEVWRPRIVKAKVPLYNKRSIYSYIGESLTILCRLIIIIGILLIITIKERRLLIKLKYKRTKKNIFLLKRELGKKKRFIDRVLK